MERHPMENPQLLRLNQVRRKRKLSQVKMADYLGLPRSTYANYELGHREPSVSLLVEIAARLGVSLDYLAGSTGFELTVDTALKFGILKKLRGVREEDKQPYTPPRRTLPPIPRNHWGAPDSSTKN